MGMTIDELVTFCKEEEHNHRLNCKRYDDASGYTRSKNKEIRTACAIREELLGNYYQQIVSTMRKYQKIEALINSWELGLIDNIGYEISEVIEDGKID